MKNLFRLQQLLPIQPSLHQEKTLDAEDLLWKRERAILLLGLHNDVPDIGGNKKKLGHRI